MGEDDLRSRFRRDYSNVPIKVKANREAEPPKPFSLPEETISRPEHKPRYKSKRRYFKFKLLLILILLTASASTAYILLRPQYLIPKTIQQQMELTLYYPSKLPSGYIVDKNSFQVSNQVLTFSASNNEDKILFTIQERPPNFDYPTFYTKGLTQADQFSTPLGQAGVGNANSRLIGSLPVDKTWVLLSSTSAKVKSADFREILLNMKKV
jgi:hypothetical protein